MAGRIYNIFFNGDMDEMSAVGYEVMLKWFQFALGMTDIGSHRVMHPTGRLASSIRMEGRGPLQIAIIADEFIAPEAGDPRRRPWPG